MSTLIVGDVAEGTKWWGVVEQQKRIMATTYGKTNPYMSQWFMPTADVKVLVKLINGEPKAFIYTALQGKGYFAGGFVPIGFTYSATIEGLDFVTGAKLNPVAVLSTARLGLAGVNSSIKGYFAGGTDGASDNPVFYKDVIDAFQFSTEAALAIMATLYVTRLGLAGVNSSTRGYFAGGIGILYHGNVINSESNEIDGIEFESETAINPLAELSYKRFHLAGVNSTAKGYFAGGQNISSSARVDGIQFDTEVVFNLGDLLSLGRDGLTGVNSSTRGYFAGGFVTTGPGGAGYYTKEIDGIQFDTETYINPLATLVSPVGYLAGVNSTSNGYLAGGSYTFADSKKIEGFKFDTETSFVSVEELREATHLLAGCQSGGSL